MPTMTLTAVSFSPQNSHVNILWIPAAPTLTGDVFVFSKAKKSGHGTRSTVDSLQGDSTLTMDQYPGCREKRRRRNFEFEYVLAGPAIVMRNKTEVRDLEATIRICSNQTAAD